MPSRRITNKLCRAARPFCHSRRTRNKLIHRNTMSSRWQQSFGRMRVTLSRIFLVNWRSPRRTNWNVKISIVDDDCHFGAEIVELEFEPNPKRMPLTVLWFFDFMFQICYSARFRFLITTNDHHYHHWPIRNFDRWKSDVRFPNKIINFRGQYYHRLNGSVFDRRLLLLFQLCSVIERSAIWFTFAMACVFIKRP